MFLVSGIAIAKNTDLQDDMVALERVYISALALTGAPEPKVEATKAKMTVYEEAWVLFNGNYEFYRASCRNWGSYFNDVNNSVGEASELVHQYELLGEAHEVLEEIRTTMAEFRGRNGFPKFIADDFTAFHSIMGKIIGIAGKDFDENTLDILDELYIEAAHAWSKVEKNPVDLYEWDFKTEDEIATYDYFIALERDALDNFEYKLSVSEYPLSDDEEQAVRSAAFGLKPNQAKAYLMLSTLPKPE